MAPTLGDKYKMAEQDLNLEPGFGYQSPSYVLQPLLSLELHPAFVTEGCHPYLKAMHH